jgi:hypothetical protein
MSAPDGVIHSLKSPKLAKKESEALIQSQLMSPMTDDPSYCCNTLLNFVQTGILTPKEILKPLKVPLKKDAIHAQLTVVNILDGLMKHGTIGVRLEIAGKKWTDRISTAGQRTPLVGARVLQLLTHWKDTYSNEPVLNGLLNAAYERWSTNRVPA